MNNKQITNNPLSLYNGSTRICLVSLAVCAVSVSLHKVGILERWKSLRQRLY